MDNETRKKKAGFFGKIGGLWKSGVKGKVICIVGVLVVLGIIGAFTDEEEGGGGLPEGDGTAKAAVKEQLQAGGNAGETKTITLPGGAEMEMVWCPPGTFMMGSPESEEGRDDDETLHRVTLTEGFWMAKTEVTQAQWKSVMGKNPSEHKGDDSLPVECVSWLQCGKFCQKAGLQLPTEAEWEYACRAGGTGAFSGGGWCAGDGGEQTHPVGRKKANVWGLQDMHGNVWEWCFDAPGSYPGGAVTNPVEGGGRHRVIRGGGCQDAAVACRAAERETGYGADGYGFVGFRPVARPD